MLGLNDGGELIVSYGMVNYSAALTSLADARAAGRASPQEVESTLHAILTPCLLQLGSEELNHVWAVMLDAPTPDVARRFARECEAASARADAPIGALARSFAAAAVLHATHALIVARSADSRLSWAACYRLSHSLYEAFTSANNAASVTPRGDESVVVDSLRQLLAAKAA